MKKGLSLCVAFLVTTFLIGATSWAAWPVKTAPAPAPAPATTLKPVLVPTVNPTPVLPAETVQQAPLQATMQTALQAQKPSPQALSTSLGSKSYALSPVQISYFVALGGNWIYPGDASGILTGSIENPNASATTGDQLHNLGWTEEICIPKPWPLSGCITKHTYGLKMGWDFNANGPVTYTYSFPYTIDFSFPGSVFPGQRIYLAPNFRWNLDIPPPTLTSAMNYTYSSGSSVWADAPFDGMDDLELGFTQYSDKAHLSWGLPVVPLFPSYKDATDLKTWPFTSGGDDFRGFSVKMGGAGSLNNTDKIRFQEAPRSVCVGATGTSGTTWRTALEQIQFTASVLEAAPPPAPVAGLALDIVRAIGAFRLDRSIEGNIFRGDWVCLELSELPYVEVPKDLKDKHWVFDLPVTLRYRVYGHSSFGFNLAFHLLKFDMRWYDPKDIIPPTPPILFWANGQTTPWVEKTATFRVKGDIPETPRTSYPAPMVYDATNTLGSTVQPTSMQRTTPPNIVGVKIATPTDTPKVPKVIQTSRTVPFPKPTALRGMPQKGEYTVVLGAAAQARADQIVALLKRLGISAYVVTRGRTTESAVTLGAFLSKAQAEQLAGMLKEVFKVDGDVVQSISGAKLRPLGDDVVNKLNIPL